MRARTVVPSAKPRPPTIVSAPRHGRSPRSRFRRSPAAVRARVRADQAVVASLAAQARPYPRTPRRFSRRRPRRRARRARGRPRRRRCRPPRRRPSAGPPDDGTHARASGGQVDMDVGRLALHFGKHHAARVAVPCAAPVAPSSTPTYQSARPRSSTGSFRLGGTAVRMLPLSLRASFNSQSDFFARRASSGG